MTTSTIDYTIAAQDRTLDAIRQSQGAVVEAVGSWAKTVDAATPERPAIPVPAGLPTVHELIQANFDFAGKLLAAQRQFASDLVSAAAPALRTERVQPVD